MHALGHVTAKWQRMVCSEIYDYEKKSIRPILCNTKGLFYYIWQINITNKKNLKSIKRSETTKLFKAYQVQNFLMIIWKKGS